jgi:signal transduction histidine kinase/ActR/RegA family two-component response regulator
MQFVSTRTAPGQATGAAGSIARSFVVSTLLITSMGLLALGATAFVTVFEPSRQALATTELGATFDAVNAQLTQVIVRAEAIARIRQDWGVAGLVDPKRPQEIVKLLGPLLDRGPHMSGFTVASESGQEVLLRRMPNGDRITRFTDPQRLRGKSIVRTWSALGQPLTEEIRDSDYDARLRPWYQGAQAIRDPQGIYWTQPYTFVSTQSPGISAVMRWTGPDGTRFTGSSDIDLTDFSRFTSQLVVGKVGFAAVFTRDGRVVGLPRGLGLASDASLKDALLKPVEALGMAPLAKGFQLWRDRSRGSAEALRFDVAGTSWLASFRRIELGDQSLLVGAFAPEADFSPLSAKHIGLLALLVASALALALLAAMRLAARYTRPLVELASESERIGRLELDEPIAVTSRWSELATVARVQETMRARLLAATRHLEVTVDERTADLVRARDAADQAARAKAAFLANMSHEIRTPMNGIIGMTELTLRTQTTPLQRQYLGKIQDCANSLLRIINDILDFSKVDAGKLTLESNPFVLDDVLRKVVQIVAPMADLKDLQLIVDRAAGVPNCLVGDAVRLEQVLLNLVSNAVKFTPGGQVRIRVDLDEAEENGLLIRFAVCDTGIGMGTDETRRLFQPFSQCDESMARRFGGTGLGLAISKRLVELMDGSIGVASAPGQGSTFTFTARFGRDCSDPKSAPDPRNPTKPSIAGARVLVVEDNEINRIVASKLLTAQGVVVSTADTGAEALVRLRSGERFDLVFMDVQMPDMDGFEATRALRALPAGETLKIVAMTAHAMTGDRERCLAAGMDDYIAKPVSPADLEACLRRWLDPVVTTS